MYKSLDTIPYKIFVSIYENEADNIHLLSKIHDQEKEDFTLEEISKYFEVWEKIKKKYLEIKLDEKDLRIFDLKKEIDFLLSKYKLISICCECLVFDFNQEIINILNSFDFKLNQENYYQDIERILLESKSILHNVEFFKSQLPKEDKNKTKSEITVDDMLASISAVLGIDFDYNEVSFNKVKSLLKQVDLKIKSLEKI